jgi:hypothetical protein
VNDSSHGMIITFEKENIDFVVIYSIYSWFDTGNTSKILVIFKMGISSYRSVWNWSKRFAIFKTELNLLNAYDPFNNKNCGLTTCIQLAKISFICKIPLLEIKY